MKRYVIIGNGIAAAGCIEGIRSVDGSGEITVISEEKHGVYCRPLISYYLEGKTDLERIRYRNADFYERMSCRVLYGRKAVRIRHDRHEAELDDGSAVGYDAVCLATGAAPFVPEYEGLDTVPRRFTFTSLDDALALEKAVGPSSRVLILGAGLIGLKCAEGLSGRAGEVTVCNRSPRILSSILDEESADTVRRHMEKNGIRFMLGETVSRFEKDRAVMSGGDTVGFDVLVTALGVRPEISLLEGTGAQTGRGALTDARMETSAAGVYAAGDCTESEDVSSGRKRVMAILPNAYMQGHAAGVNMAGGSEVFDKAIPMNSMGLFGLHVMTAGSYEGETYTEKTEESFKRLFTSDGLLKGFIIIGGCERAGIYTAMIREKTPIASVDFEMLKKTASTAAYPPQMRRKMFGGVV